MKKKAFTLIELLVVISIIALLLSILLPALGLAKQQAMYVICKTRLKDLGLAERLYAEDNNDYIAGGSDTWRRQIIPYYGFEGTVSEDKFLKEFKDPWTCPAAIKKDKPDKVALGNRTFAINRGTTQFDVLRKLYAPRNTAETMMFVCAAQFRRDNLIGNRYYGGDTWTQYCLPGSYHFGTDFQSSEFVPTEYIYVDGRSNVLFFDGHIGGIKYVDWPSIYHPDPPYSLKLFWKGGLW